MDRDVLLRTVPDGATFNTLPPIERQAAAADLIAAILAAIRNDGRQADVWEGPDLGGAIGYLACGWYNAAVTLAVRALTPPEGRCDDQVAPLDGDFGLDVLDRRLDEARRYAAR